MSQLHQVGQVSPPFTSHAALWSGTAASFVDLHPAGQRSSLANDVAGDQQVGSVNNFAENLPRAALWRGSAASYVDLHPAGAYISHAFATDGSRQGGRVHWLTGPVPGWHATLWDGSAGSAVSLNPSGVDYAEVRAMAPGVQVGLSRPPGLPNAHAALWTGTAASFLDLNPPGVPMSEINGTTGALHAGTAWFGGVAGACLWLDNTGQNVMNLHTLLPPGFFTSVATGIYEESGQIWISGYAEGPGRREAFLWTNIPAPGSGMVALFGLAAWARRKRSR